MMVAGMRANTAGLDFLATAEYGIQEGEFKEFRIKGAKTEEEALEAVTDFFKRNFPVEFPKMNIKLAEVIAEEVEEAI